MAFLPAFTPPDPDSGGEFHFNPWPALNYADSIYRDSLNKIQACINGCVNQCQTTANLCMACVSGCVDRNLEVIEGIVQKKDAKLEANMIGIIGQAYAVAINYGYQMPTPEELIQSKAQKLSPTVKQFAPPMQPPPGGAMPVPPPPGGGQQVDTQIGTLDPTQWYVIEECGGYRAVTGSQIIANAIPQPYKIVAGPFGWNVEAFNKANDLNRGGKPPPLPGCPEEDLLGGLGGGGGPGDGKDGGGEHGIETGELFQCPDGSFVIKPEDCKGATIEHTVPDCPAPVVNCPPPLVQVNPIINVPPCTKPPPEDTLPDGGGLDHTVTLPGEIVAGQSDQITAVAAIKTGPGFCEDLYALKAAWSQFGSTIRKGFEIQVGSLIDLVAATRAIPGNYLETMKASLSGMSSWSTYGKMQAGYYLPAIQILGGDVECVMNLMAVKQYLAYLGTAKEGVESSGGVKGEASAGIDFKVPVVGISFGADLKGEYSGAVTTHSELQRVIVPLVELLDRLILACVPSKIPTISESIGTYLAGEISQNHLRCLVELNGGNWQEYETVVWAARSKVNIDEAFQLYRRGKINKQQLYDLAGRNGYLDFHDTDWKYELTNLYPGPSDLVRFMTRDTDDTATVNKFGMDAEFNQKFQQTLQQWAQYAGVPNEVMQHYWRAHWRIPSPQMLFEMLHRLRPEKPDVKQGNYQVTLEEVNAALSQDDWLPYWQPRLTAISYRPLTRVDARRMYATGLVDRQSFVSLTRDLGYDTNNAELVAKWMDQETIKQAMATDPAKAYLKYGIGVDGLQFELTAKGYSIPVIQEAIRRLDDKLTWDNTAKCVDGASKKYLNGDIDEVTLNKALITLGLSHTQITTLISRLNCQMKHKEKAETASQICEWYQNGLISPAELSQRLVNIGYSADNAGKIASMCQIKLAEKIYKQQQKEADKAKKEQEKAQKEYEKAQKAAEQAAEKTQKMQDAFLKSAYKRQEDIIGVASRVAKLNGSHIDYEASKIGSVVFGLLSDPKAEPDEVYGAVDIAAKALPSSGPVDFPPMILQAYNAEKESPIFPPPLPPTDGGDTGDLLKSKLR